MAQLEKFIADRFDALSATFPCDIDRNDARLKALISRSGDPRGKKILEVGCGKGRFARVFKELGADIYGIDISAELLKEAKQIDKDKFLEAGVYEMPFKDRQFDIVYLVEVIEHIPDICKAIKEIARVMRKEGTLIVIDRNILSLNNRRMFVPNVIIKKYHEMKNEWMYPKGSVFSEKWFMKDAVCKFLKKEFAKVDSTYIISDSELNSKTAFLFKLFPVTRHFIAWTAKEPKK